MRYCKSKLECPAGLQTLSTEEAQALKRRLPRQDMPKAASRVLVWATGVMCGVGSWLERQAIGNAVRRICLNQWCARNYCTAGSRHGGAAVGLWQEGISLYVSRSTCSQHAVLRWQAAWQSLHAPVLQAGGTFMDCVDGFGDLANACRGYHHGFGYRECKSTCRKAAKDGNMDIAVRDSTTLTGCPDQVRRLPGPRASGAGCGPPSDWPEGALPNNLRPP